MISKKALLSWSVVLTTGALVACGGGGSAPTLYYPYETVFGDICRTSEPTPGCTFDAQTGQRIKVVEDSDYNRFGYGSDDLWYVVFDASGRGAVYNDLGRFQYYQDASQFSGYIGGTTIGVGNTGLFWENIAGGTYWVGRTGVLYNANEGESRYGQAINEQGASEASDANFAAISSDSNKKLVAMASQKLVTKYGFKKDKATAIASSLNSWAIAASERGFTTSKDMDKTFKTVFGVQFSEALAAAKDLQLGDNQSMQDVTSKSAAALGLKPHQAQRFMKDMYKKALADYGYDSESIAW